MITHLKPGNRVLFGTNTIYSTNVFNRVVLLINFWHPNIGKQQLTTLMQDIAKADENYKHRVDVIDFI
jgi:hypothetical protein